MFQFLCTWSFNLRMETVVQEVPLLVCLETIQQLGSLHLSMYTCRQGCHCLRLTDGFDEGCHFSILQRMGSNVGGSCNDGSDIYGGERNMRPKSRTYFSM
ncbi:hypothetical protein ACQJBY_037681 [Aegilops geniculata]